MEHPVQPAKRRQVLADNGSNYKAWLINLRALLRSQSTDLWTPIQTPVGKSSQEKVRVHQLAADFITPTLGDELKQLLDEEDFEDGYLLLQHVKNLFAATTDAAYMRYSRELFSLSIDRFGGDVEAFVARTKELSSAIDACNIEFTEEKRKLLVLSMGIEKSREFSHLAPIWSAMPQLRADQAVSMLREQAVRAKEEKKEPRMVGEPAAFMARKEKKVGGKSGCPKCGKSHSVEDCWQDVRCDFCHRKGHPERVCRTKQEVEEEEEQEEYGSRRQTSKAGSSHNF